MKKCIYLLTLFSLSIEISNANSESLLCCDSGGANILNLKGSKNRSQESQRIGSPLAYDTISQHQSLETNTDYIITNHTVTQSDLNDMGITSGATLYNIAHTASKNLLRLIDPNDNIRYLSTECIFKGPTQVGDALQIQSQLKQSNDFSLCVLTSIMHQSNTIYTSKMQAVSKQDYPSDLDLTTAQKLYDDTDILYNTLYLADTLPCARTPDIYANIHTYFKDADEVALKYARNYYRNQNVVTTRAHIFWFDPTLFASKNDIYVIPQKDNCNRTKFSTFFYQDDACVFFGDFYFASVAFQQENGRTTTFRISPQSPQPQSHL